MTQLLREGAPWSCGWTALGSMEEVGASILPTSVECSLGGQRAVVLLDTGATYGVLSPKFAERLQGVEKTGLPVRIRHGNASYRGELVRVPLRLLAEHGDDLELTVQLCLSEEWERQVAVIGVRFGLEQLRLGFEPASGADAHGRLYFGPARG